MGSIAASRVETSNSRNWNTLVEIVSTVPPCRTAAEVDNGLAGGTDDLAITADSASGKVILANAAAGSF